MPDIPIHNETEYALSTAILEQIKRDALEYFGESIRAIRIQYGIDRHAFNARTGEMRYAFSPGDFGMVDTITTFPEPYHSRDVPSIDDDTEELEDVTYEDVDVEVDDDTAPSLESLDEELDDTEDEQAPFHGLHDEFDTLEDDEEEDKDFAYDEDEDEEYN